MLVGGFRSHICGVSPFDLRCGATIPIATRGIRYGQGQAEYSRSLKMLLSSWAGRDKKTLAVQSLLIALICLFTLYGPRTPTVDAHYGCSISIKMKICTKSKDDLQRKDQQKDRLEDTVNSRVRILIDPALRGPVPVTTFEIQPCGMIVLRPLSRALHPFHRPRFLSSATILLWLFLRLCNLFIELHPLVWNG